jgi:hypothetical protein
MSPRLGLKPFRSTQELAILTKTLFQAKSGKLTIVLTEPEIRRARSRYMKKQYGLTASFEGLVGLLEQATEWRKNE